MPRRINTSNEGQLTEADIVESKPLRNYQNAEHDEDIYGATPPARPATMTTRASVAAADQDTAVYAWNTPLEDVAEPASYHYEPQGELLKTDSETLPAESQMTDDGAGNDLPTQTLRQSGTAAGSKRKAGPDNVGSASSGASRRRAPISQPSQVTFSQDKEAPLIAESGSQLALPPRKVFPIQVGDKLFRLSGASISSDSPSYFSQFFQDQLRQNEEANHIRTLYIDRDPATFEDIALHLKGYHIEPRDGAHYVKLFADAQFFSLPRLTAQLFASPIYIKIGDTDFQIPRDVFNNPGDSPNYFTLGFSMFFTTPDNVFPGLSQRTLLRPPSILPPSVPQRSAKTFQDILHLLKGYPLEVRNEAHREELLRDARYYHLKGLEQRLIPHQMTYNLGGTCKEILIRLEDVRQSGVTIDKTDTATDDRQTHVFYQRPYVDDEARGLVLEIGGDESTLLTFTSSAHDHTAAWVHRRSYCRYSNTDSPLETFALAEFSGPTLARISTLVRVVANKHNMPVRLPFGLLMSKSNSSSVKDDDPPDEGTGKFRVAVSCDADVLLNGEKWRHEEHRDNLDGEKWFIKRSHWQILTHALEGSDKRSVETVLDAVKIEAYTDQERRNFSRRYLQ